MKSAGIVLIASGIFVIAVVLHTKHWPSSSSSPSGSPGGSSGGISSGGGSGSVQQYTVALPGGGDITVNASDPQAALDNVSAETGQQGTGFLSGPGGQPTS